MKTKLDKSRYENREIDSDIFDCSARLTTKKSELEAWQEKETALNIEFRSMVQDNHPFQPPLFKAFRRKMKRFKKVSQDDDGCTEVENDDDDEDFDEDFDEDDDVDDSCPPGCDATLYEHVIELRDKRLDQEEVSMEFQRVIDDLKRTCDRHAQRKKQIERDLNSFTKELQGFQTEKQQHLNQFSTAQIIL